MSESMSYEPTPQTRRRIVHKLDGRHGVVLEDDGHGSLHIHWGTTTQRNSTTGDTEPKLYTEWVSCHDVVTSDEPVYFGTDTGSFERELVYNPMEHL
jgi:hypothetical protein